MKRNIFSVALIILLSCLISGQEIIEKGKLKIYFLGEEVGFEEYSLIKKDSDFYLVCSGEMKKPMSLKINKMEITYDKNYFPVKFFLDASVNNIPQQITSTFKEGKAVNEIKIKEEPRILETPIKPGTLILPNGIFSTYIIALKRYDFEKRGKQEFPAYILPQQELTFSMELKEVQEIELKTGKITTEHLSATLAGVLTEDIWVDKKGKLIKFSTPSQGIEIFGEEIKIEEEVIWEKDGKREIERGRYEIFIQDSNIGYSEFALKTDGNNCFLYGRNKITLGTISQDAVSFQEYNVELEPIQYNIKGKWNGKPFEIKGNVEENKIKTFMSDAKALKDKDFIKDEKTIFLNDLSFYDYLIFFKKLEKLNLREKKFYGIMRPTSDVLILELYRIPVNISFVEKENSELNGKTITLKRYFLDIAGTEGLYAWKYDRKIIKFFSPFKYQVAFLKGFENIKTLEIPKREVKPVNYTSEDVIFQSGDLKLTGSVTIPKYQGKKFPAAVLVSGSGPQDRNEDTPGKGGLKFGIFKIISHYLSENGILVLRYDDRGIGKSEGNFADATDEDFVSDAESAVKYLRSRDDVDPDKIFIVGHSEGGIIAPRVALNDQRLAGIVLMAGTGTRGSQVLIEQTIHLLNSAELSQDEINRAMEIQEKVIKALSGEMDEKEVEEYLVPMKPQMKWIKSFINYDPSKTIKKVKCPILIINGGKDIQVLSYHAKKLAEIAKTSGNKNVTLKIFPSLNHLFIKSKSGNVSEYAFQLMENKNLSEEFLDYLIGWIKTHTNN